MPWAGAAVVILSAGVAVALAATVIILALQHETSAETSELIGVMATIAGAAVGAVGAWLGGREPGHGEDDAGRLGGNRRLPSNMLGVMLR